VLEAPDLVLVESNAICRFLAANTALYQGSPADLARIDNLLDLSLGELEPAINNWINPILGFADYVPAVGNRAIADVKSILSQLEKTLGSSEFLTGSALTIADIAVFSALAMPYRMVFDSKFFSSFKNVARWFDGIKAREEVLAVFGKIFPCKVAQPFPEPKAPKAAAPAKAAAPKAEAPEEEKNAKKPENPLDLLPPTALDLDTWKKLYSNNPSSETLPAFWKMFDKEGWSIWKVDYEKIEGELEKVHMSNNMLNGFLQRMEAMRKYSFGYLGIYGDEPDLNIKGVFFWRGLTVP